MDFKLLTNLSQLLQIEADYNSLLEHIPEREIFYEFAWLKNYIMYYPDSWASKQDNLRIVTGWQGKNLVVLCPFCMRGKTLSFITDDATDYNMILVDSRLNIHSALKDTFLYIRQTIPFKKMQLNNFRSSDTLLNLYIILNYGGGYKSFMTVSSVAPFCNVKTDGEKFVKKHVSDIRRRERNLLKEHAVRYEDSCELTEQDLAFITRIKDADFGKNIFSKQRSWQFFQKLNEEMPASFSVNRCFVDGALAALHFGFQGSETVWYYIPVYEEAYRNLGIGKMLLLHIIEKAAADGKTVFDSLRGEEAYKFDFCDRIAGNFTLTVIPQTRLTKARLFCYRAGQFVLRKIFLP